MKRITTTLLFFLVIILCTKSQNLTCPIIQPLTSPEQALEWLNSQKAMGFVTCMSPTDATPYDLKGGKGGRVTILRNTGGDARQQIIDAVINNDIIVFDGSQGDFLVSSSMPITGVSHKTIIGINDARVCTKLQITSEIHKILDAANVLSLSTNGKEKGPFWLSNGNRVGEECEAAVRELLIEYFNDPEEKYRQSGLFQLRECEDIIICNLRFKGPGAIDVGGDDLLTVSRHTRHLWVYCCDFVDGMDGNFDINGFADLITVSRCRFSYTDNTYQHANTNLIGSNDRAEINGEDALNVTFHQCIWDHGCSQRMPMARFGTIHLLNCLYDCPGAYVCVNPRSLSEVLVEGCYFSRNVRHPYRQDGAKAVEFRGNVFREVFNPIGFGKVAIPYKYVVLDSWSVPSFLRE